MSAPWAKPISSGSFLSELLRLLDRAVSAFEKLAAKSPGGSGSSVQIDRIEGKIDQIIKKEGAMADLGQLILDKVTTAEQGVKSLIALLEELKARGTIDQATFDAIMAKVQQQQDEVDAALTSGPPPPPPPGT